MNLKINQIPFKLQVMECIGQRIRWRRESLSLSQKALALSLGVTSQQIQKYETGANMISAVGLYSISHILSVPLSFFFEETISIEPCHIVAEASSNLAQEHNPLYQEALQLTEAFLKIQDPNVRGKILGLTQDLVQLKG